MCKEMVCGVSDSHAIILRKVIITLHQGASLSPLGHFNRDRLSSNVANICE
jgi:hypothetical protein